MQLTSVILVVAGALSAVAHPSAQPHGHNHLHRRAGKGHTYWRNIHHHPIPQPKPTPTPVATPAAPVSAAPAPAAPSQDAPPPPPPPASTPSSGGGGTYKPFCSAGGAPSAVNKRVTLEQIKYVGELGLGNGCPWNSNIIEVPAAVADQYQYVQRYTNVAGSKYQVRCANKMGADGELTGMFDVPSQVQLVFDLQPGESKYVAAMGNTQMVCAFAPGTVGKTTHGQFAGNWVETDFGNTSNNKWSGADCSSLVAQAYGLGFPGCRVCQPGGVCSTIWENGKSDNAYTTGMEALDGIGLNIPAGKVFLEVSVGYS